MGKKVVETRLSFPRILICTSELSGRNFIIEINGYKGKLYFPRIKDDWTEDLYKESNNYSYDLQALDSPKIGLFKYKNDESWGMVRNHYGVLAIKSCLITFEFSKYQHFRTASKSIAEKLISYLNRLTLFLEIISGLTFEKNIEKRAEITVPSFRTIINGKTEYANITTISGKSSFVFNNIGITPYTMLKSIKLTNNDKRPHLSHYYLHSAKASFAENELRKSILDIGTALEIALTEKCESVLKQKNNTRFIDEILTKFKTLGGRLELAESLNINLKIDKYIVQKQVVNLRNEAIHKGRSHTLSEVKKAIEIGDNIIRRLCKYNE
jgi:hypothetical protein